MATLYNPCWQFLVPEVPFRVGGKEGYLEHRPQTSLAGTEAIYDQILVSKSLLTEPRLTFREEDVCLFCDNLNSEHAGGGRRRPRRWSNAWVQGTAGVSDHFPISARIRIR